MRGPDFRDHILRPHARTCSRAATETNVVGVRAARERHGIRVQGVLIGNTRSLAMNAICDDVAPFTNWAALLG